MEGLVNEGMDKGSMMELEDKIEKTDIYICDEAVRDMKHKKDTEDFNTSKTQTPQHTESDSVRIGSSRAALVCLGLLCVLLLTAVIVLCVYIHTKSTNYTEERDQLLTTITSLTKERDQLITETTNLTEERDQLITKTTNLTEERDQLITKTTNLTEERDQLITKTTNLTEERDQLITKTTNLTEERDHLIIQNGNLTKEIVLIDGWTNYQYSVYFISSEKKSWTESRRYCTDRGADLIIINNKEEQNFVRNITSSADLVWIGLTDSDVEGTWKWVDGTSMTSGFSFWGSGEPNGNTNENCALIYSSGWADYPLFDRDYTIFITTETMKCFICGKYGHIKTGCPVVKEAQRAKNGSESDPVRDVVENDLVKRTTESVASDLNAEISASIEMGEKDDSIEITDATVPDARQIGTNDPVETVEGLKQSGEKDRPKVSDVLDEVQASSSRAAAGAEGSAAAAEAEGSAAAAETEGSAAAAEAEGLAAAAETEGSAAAAEAEGLAAAAETEGSAAAAEAEGLAAAAEAEGLAAAGAEGSDQKSISQAASLGGSYARLEEGSSLFPHI
ncbi:uncharacterized protein [Chanodichthys erythropterus]|uniref:uncharacterized protein n=1 Tax=Chanodichthys erythropterus TaxID=933992 RepID=UPI00351F1512